MAGSRLVRTALQCYPQRWRNRHGEEAAELARLLIRDGTPARSIAWSYFKGAASTRLVPPPRRRAGAAVGALLAAARGTAGVPADSWQQNSQACSFPLYMFVPSLGAMTFDGLCIRRPRH